MRPSTGKAILAGFVATVVLTLIMYYVAPMMIGGPMDVAQMLSDMLGGLGWTVGMIVHFILGSIVFPLIYVYVLYPYLPGAPWLKGTIWGAILWLITELVVIPMAGAGLFHTQHPAGITAAVASLLGHLVYGAILGAIAGGPATSSHAATARA